MNTKIEVSGESYTKDFLLGSVKGQSVLLSARNSESRPRCLCVPEKPEMYVSRRGGHFFLSRMPGTGDIHAPECASHLGIRLQSSNSTTADAILARVWSDAHAILGQSQHRAIGWSEIRDAVRAAAKSIEVDLAPLAGRLLVPEPFNKRAAELQAERYATFFSRRPGEQDQSVRYWVFGILKDAVPRQYSIQGSIKHMPTFKFWLDNQLADSFPSLPLPSDKTVLCLLSCRPVKTGVAVDEAATILVSSNFSEDFIFPVPTEKMVKEACIYRGLPPNTSRDALFACLLRDCLARK